MKTKHPAPNSFPSMRPGLAVLCGLGLFAGQLRGQTIQNPSFEADNFTTSPGYISVNFPITGWTGSPAGQVGINPAGGQSPFANNGVIPNGAKVAFIQSQSGSPGVLSTVISGLTAGQNYTVNFRLNARTNAYVPFLKVAIDAQSIVNMSVNQVQVGTTLPYKYAAFDFTATAATQTLYLTNDAAGDHTVLVDDFRINLSTNHWSYAAWTGDADSGVDSLKNYTHAYNFGGGAAPDTTINGVLFKGVVGANPVVGSDFSINGLGSAYGSDEANNINSGGSAAMARRFIYGGNPGYFFIAGLVPGKEYVATFYTVAWETGMRAQTFSYYDDRLTVNQDHFNDNNGIRISYRYTAPASGAITLMQTPTLAANTMHLYGFANCEANPQNEPVIGLQPRSQVTTPGSTASFSVTAGGVRPLTYQWYQDGSLLSGQTGRFLTLSNISGFDLGEYTVVVANANGSVTSQVATLTFGTIANPSFEADVFRIWPGYATNNTPISGWAANNTGRAGVNPLPDYPGPFANAGAIPDGSQVAFLQSNGSTNWLSTILDGLAPGQKYTLTFRAAARSGQTPLVRAAVDGQQVAEFRVGSVVAASPYRYVAFDFTPATASPVLYLTNDAAGDHTVLLDDVRIAESTTKWSYAAWNDDATSGVDPARGYSHAYNFGGAGLAVDTTINGVRFRGVSGPNPLDSGRLLTANLPTAYTADPNTVTTNGGGSALLAQSFLYYGGTIPSDLAQTITLSNLVPGVEYEATIFGVGWDAKYYARAATFTVGQDRQTFSEDAFDNNNGIRVIYRYVADASGAKTLTYWPTERNSSFHTYGVCNAEVTSTLPPVVYRQPQGRTVAGGATVILDCLVGGQGPLFLQWRKDGVNLTDQTNLVLTMASVDGSATGDYTLIISNALGVVTSVVARVEVGLAMANPSFEVDTFTVFPGYIGGNFPITGWTASLPAQTGLNPAGGQSPFANTGTIPDGAQVAFIQANGGVLSQVVTGMVVGKTYYLKFFENARTNYPAGTLAVTFGGETIVPAHVVSPGQYVRVVSGPFLATTDAAELAFIKTAGPQGGDSTVLIDNVAVLELPPTPPTFLIQPQSVYLKQGDTLTLTALAQGSLPMSYQWQRDEADLGGEMATTLTLPGILMSEAGNYTLIVENTHGRTTSSVAVVRVGLGIAELFNTGVDDTGALLPGGVVDPHYQLISSADPAWPGPNAMTHLDQYPVGGTAYMSNGPSSLWIGPRVNETGYPGNLDGNYIYRTAFILDTLDPATVEIRGKWAMDNTGWDIRLNGVSLGISNNTGFAVFGAFTITSGFVAGSNTLDFVISNAPPPGPTALRVEVYGVAMPLPPTTPQLVGQPASLLAQELSDIQLVALALGSPPLTYQWYYEGFDLPGETGRKLRLTNVAKDQEGSYWVVASNNSGSVTSTVAVLTVNRAPIAGQDPVGTGRDLTLAIPIVKLLHNDSDPDGDPVAFVAASAASTNGGSVTVSNSTVVYTPVASFVGYDLFTYTIGDSRGGTGTGTVLVQVGASNFLNLVSPPTILENGHFHVAWAGIPGYTYTVDWAPTVIGPWTTLTNLTAAPNGLFELEDPTEPAPPVRFYRTTYP